MASTAERTALMKDLAPTIENLDPATQQEAIKAAIAGPDAVTTNLLWRIVVPGLVGLIALALIGIVIVLLADKGADALATAFSALLAGLLGLFVQSPVPPKVQKEN
jgi:hypothetical protein